MSIFMVSANEAKKLRPSLMAAAVLIIGLVAVLVGQIGLNMVLTHDAYELRSLKLEKWLPTQPRFCWISKATRFTESQAQQRQRDSRLLAPTWLLTQPSEQSPSSHWPRCLPARFK